MVSLIYFTRKLYITSFNIIDRLILMTCQPVKDYSMPAYIVPLYIHFFACSYMISSIPILYK